MSEFHVNAVRIGQVEKHPDADSLSITMVHGGYPCIFRDGQFKEGDLAVYVPEASVVPLDDPRFAFLGTRPKDAVIRARRLRGVFSMGLLVEASEGMQEGDDVAAAMRITKYEAPEEAEVLKTGGHQLDEKDPGCLPTYTDLEGFRKFSRLITPGEEVVLTEKIHGENARFVFQHDRLFVGSRTRIKKDPSTYPIREFPLPSGEVIVKEPKSVRSQWWSAARQYHLEEKLREYPGISIYGEVHGYTKGFPYGVPPGELAFRMFDAMDVKTHRWFDFDEMVELAVRLGVPIAPVLFRGPWSDDLKALAEGNSTLDSRHVREGFVVRPIKERRDPRHGRVVLKFVGEGYLLKKK